tara:strand:- start:5704 stop:6036 length:333 start_codon:yes stop_codon:yes gene_type:complete
MSDILEKMRAAHAARELKAVPVPEYGDVWYFMPLTLGERSRIRKMAGSDDDMVLSVETLILKALDEKGARKFEDGAETREVLFAMGLTLLQRIMTEAEGGEATSEPVKNA